MLQNDNTQKYWDKSRLFMKETKINLWKTREDYSKENAIKPSIPYELRPSSALKTFLLENPQNYNITLATFLIQGLIQS